VTTLRGATATVLAVVGVALLSAAFVDWVGYTWFVVQWAMLR